MMEILVAKNAGFCFGVKKAMDEALKASSEKENVRTLGPIIHNYDAVRQLEKNGVKILNDINDIEKGQTVIIRSHGIGKEELEKMKDMGIDIIDATCPYVKNIHNIVEKNYQNGYQIIIVGDANHPEVKGINGWCGEKAYVVNDSVEINEENFRNKKVCVVAQTTFNSNKWHQIVCEIVKFTKEALIINTICSATEIRQKETQEIAREVELMIVVGGKDSSNTKKLFEISKENCREAIFIESAKELDLDKIRRFNKIGITAGASTPQFIIDEVIENIKLIEYKNKESSEKIEKFQMTDKNEEIDYFADFTKIEIGDIVKGRVIHVTNNEVYVDIGYKSDGILPLEEASNLPINLKECFKAGDEIEVEVIKMNDVEGNVVLSRRGAEKQEFIQKLIDYKEQGKTIEVDIVKEVKAGFECRFKDLRCFMPISHAGLKDEEASTLVGKKVKVNIIEIKQDNDKVNIVVSRRETAKDERIQKAKDAIKYIKEGQIVRGRVKNIISAGAFVEYEDIDIFVPVSELSWKKIQKAEDVLSIGQTIEIIIIKVNPEELKVTGSYKRTQETPWDIFKSKYNVEDIVDGKIVSLTDYGAFVELEEGVQGLVHISNMSNIRINKPSDIARIGQKVKVKIIGIEDGNKKVLLSIKDAKN